MRLHLLLSTIFLTALALPAGATAASQTTAPPGNSGISQYVEVVPSSTGGKPSTHKSNKNPLSAKERRKLSSSADGQRLSQVVAGTAPDAATSSTTIKKAKKGSRHARSGGTDTSRATEAKKAASVAAAYAAGSGGGGGPGSGIGIPLIGLMAAAAVVVGGMALTRRRGGGIEAEPEL